MVLQHNDILKFWFSEKVRLRWFVKDGAFDQRIREEFLSVYEDACAGRLDAWKHSASGILALILVFDQFPRNMFRDSPRAFAMDAQARALVYEGLEQGYDTELSEVECVFFYMPLMHSERLEDQETSVGLYEALGRADNLEFAVRHRDIVARFGRFPHRNAVLGRTSTEEEVAFLTQPGSSF